MPPDLVGGGHWWNVGALWGKYLQLKAVSYLDDLFPIRDTV